MAQKTVKKILIIEDAVETQNLFMTALQLEGFSTISAETGLIGLHKAQEYLPDVIICEIRVPELDGYSILKKLRKNFATVMIPLIFVTVKVSRFDIRKGMELGADDYLTKPCTVEELLGAIAACLKKRATLEQCYTEQATSFSNQLSSSESIFSYHPQLVKVFNFIESNYFKQITLGEVAQQIGYSPAYLTNLVRRITGKTVQNWIIERRMAAARSLLLLTGERVDKIAAKVGYHNTVHFFRQFRQYHGTTPQAWRNTQMEDKKDNPNNC